MGVYGRELQITIPVARVLRELLDDPSQPMYGLDLMRATGLKSGSMYPLLRRLQVAEWVTDSWEQLQGNEARPRRRYYQLTTEGVELARLALAGLPRADPAPSRPILRPAPRPGHA
jgi:PadR family transcriptional regulator, regulatory protein PadR